MSFTGQLGTSFSYLANIELGVGAGSSPPVTPTWFPFDLQFVAARRLRQLICASAAADFPAALYPVPPPPPGSVWIPPAQEQAAYHGLGALLARRVALTEPLALSPALMPGFTPTPGPPFNVFNFPAIPKVFSADDWQRLRKALEQTSEMLNSLMAQGYIQRTSIVPITWQILGKTGGVLSFDGRTGAVTLTANDVIAAFGAQNPHAVFAGPGPSFRLLTASDVPGIAGNFAQVIWGTPGALTSQTITVSAALNDLNGNPFSSDVCDIELTITDGIADSEPSHTATLSAAGSPIGILMAGSGTASVTVRTASGAPAFNILASEASSGSVRYLWVCASRNTQISVTDGGQPLRLQF
jgi:hypothetical protein